MKRPLILLLLGLVACKKDPVQPLYRGDLINIQIESKGSVLSVNNIVLASNVHKLDTNIWLFAKDTIRIMNIGNGIDTQQIQCLVNYNKYYRTTYYNGIIYDSIKACPSWSKINYAQDSLIFTIVYRHRS